MKKLELRFQSQTESSRSEIINIERKILNSLGYEENV